MSRHDDFLRIGLLDARAVVVAFSPRVDEQGVPTRGKNYADRPFIPVLKQTRQPMFSDVELARTGAAGPRVALLAPVVSHGQYAGHMIGVLDLDRLYEPLALSEKGQMVQGLLFTIVDPTYQGQVFPVALGNHGTLFLTVRLFDVKLRCRFSYFHFGTYWRIL